MVPVEPVDVAPHREQVDEHLGVLGHELSPENHVALVDHLGQKLAGVGADHQLVVLPEGQHAPRLDYHRLGVLHGQEGAWRSRQQWERVGDVLVVQEER